MVQSHNLLSTQKKKYFIQWNKKYFFQIYRMHFFFTFIMNSFRPSFNSASDNISLIKFNKYPIPEDGVKSVAGVSIFSNKLCLTKFWIEFKNAHSVTSFNSVRVVVRAVLGNSYNFTSFITQDFSYHWKNNVITYKFYLTSPITLT